MPPRHKRTDQATGQWQPRAGWPHFIDYRAPCADEHASGLDQATAHLVQIGYAAVSALTGDPLPRTVLDTFLRRQGTAFDGILVLREAQVDRVIARSDSLRAAVELQTKLIIRALGRALSSRGETSSRAAPELYAWAVDIVDRLRRKAQSGGGAAFEDVTTGDYAEIVHGARAKGKWLQLDPSDDFAHYISFGSLRLHFEGRITYIPKLSGGHQLLQWDLRPCLNDTFDFHFAQEDPGTGWIDHALARLQRSVDAKPFRIEGAGSPTDHWRIALLRIGFVTYHGEILAHRFLASSACDGSLRYQGKGASQCRMQRGRQTVGLEHPDEYLGAR